MKAYDRLVKKLLGKEAHYSQQDIIDVEQALTEYEVLKQRDTAMKVLNDDYNGFICPSCKGYAIQVYRQYGDRLNLRFCNDCGQRLEWGE
jgi:hypothetical protein